MEHIEIWMCNIGKLEKWTRGVKPTGVIPLWVVFRIWVEFGYSMQILVA